MSQKPEPRLLSQLRRLFGSDTSQAATVPGANRRPSIPTPHSAPRADAGGAHLDRQAAQRLQEVLASHPPDAGVVGGKINLLNIGELKERLGGKWARYEDRVHYIVSETLQRRLTDKDFFARNDEETYIVVFHDSSETEAKLKCALLGQEISKKFFGEADIESDCPLHVETVVATVDGRFVREGVNLADAMAEALSTAEKSEANQARRLARKGDGLTMEEVRQLLGEAEERIHELERREQDVLDIEIVRDHMRELVRELRNIESVLASPDQTWVGLEAAGNSTSSAGLPWKGGHAQPSEIVREIITHVDSRIEKPEKTVIWVYDDDEKDAAALDLDIAYPPIWSVARERVGLYLCKASMHTATRAPESGGAGDLNLLDAMDRITLRRAKADLQATVSAGRASIVVIPVHYSTLTRPGPTESYLRICHAIPRDLRQMIVWEIRKAPLDSWTTQLSRIVSVLRPLGRAVFVLFDRSAIPEPRLHSVFGRLASHHVQGVGLDLATYRMPEADLMTYLGRFGPAAKTHKLSAYVHGIDTVSLNTAAVCSGFDHLSGRAVAEPLAKPKGLFPKELESVYFPAQQNR